jgi:hypothetical protein
MGRFEQFMTNTIVLIKTGGTRIEAIKARVKNNEIKTYDVSLRVEQQDIVERQLPNGLKETYTVLDVVHNSGLPPGIPASQVMNVRKPNAVRAKLRPTIVHHYHGVQSVQQGNESVAYNTQNFGLDPQEIAELIVKMRISVNACPKRNRKKHNSL